MERDITRAIERAEKSAKINPTIDTSRLGSQGDRAGRDFMSRFSSSSSSGGTQAGSAVGKAFIGGFAALVAGGGLAAVAGTVVDQFRAIVETGLDFSKTMNNFQGVTRSTAAQMQEVGSAARALGSDTTLAGASSADAATAMTELAKAGFSVDQAMTAARGTLELATAGQISAAQAAEIQSNAMNAFSLDATNAAHVADLFANAAVASSADIPDLGVALQQVGGIAHGFGENLDDTIAALGIFANAGVKGSDAGTLLKTTMQSITDQGAPAQEAIHGLGLELYKINNEGQNQFVGFRELFRQLDEAKKRLNDPEQFQALTNILFGSDAMRSAMLGNADAFDEMLASIEHVGGASELASSQMQGLPGAVESFKNSVEGIQLDVFDAIGPQLTGGLNDVVTWMSTHKQEIVQFFFDIASAALSVGADVVRSFAEMTQATGQFTGGLGKVLDFLGVDNEMAQISDTMNNLSTGMFTAADSMDTASDKVKSFGDAAATAADYATTATGAVAGLGTQVGALPFKKVIEVTAETADAQTRLGSIGDAVKNLPFKKTIEIEMHQTQGNPSPNGSPNGIFPPILSDGPLSPDLIPPKNPLRMVPRRAGGGQVFGPGTGTSDSILAWLSNEEFVVNADATKKNLPLLQVINSGLIPGFAEGGSPALPSAPGDYVVQPDNVMTALQFAQSVSGTPYSYGSAGPTMFDCSGFMSAIYGIVTGKSMPSGQRYFTTESDFSKLGFLPGFDPTSPFNIGVHNGGGGKNSHMAGSLMGYNIESGGASGTTQIGGSAAGPTDPQFEKQYHLPGSAAMLGMGQSGGSYEVDQQQVFDAETRVLRDRNDLEVQRKQLAELEAKGTATESQLLAARNDVAEQERDVQSSEAKLAEAKQGKLKKISSSQGSSSSSGGMDASSLGQSLVSGLLQGIGLDGSVFSNPLEWPNVKSAMALLNFGGGLLAGDGSTDPSAGGPLGGAFGAAGLPTLANLLTPSGPQATSPVDPGTTTHGAGFGAAPGPLVAYNGTVNMGVDPRAMTQRQSADMNQAWRRNMPAVKP